MDYAFVNALRFVISCKVFLLMYDIMCQWYPRFPQRIESVHEALGVAPDFLQTLTIKRGIGLFHVHSHIKECYAQYAPSFIVGAGVVDGEVIETLWADLNEAAGSLRAMGTGHRQETLDMLMSDSNWKKLIAMRTYHRGMTGRWWCTDVCVKPRRSFASSKKRLSM